VSTATFYYPALRNDIDQMIHLQGREAWHALGVRRLNPGDAIRIMNGKGRIADGSVDRVDSQKEAWVRVLSVREIPACKPDIVLASAIAKGDRQSTMLDMVTQLGVSAYQPLQCERSVTKVSKNAVARWERVCLEACKQSGSAWLPEIFQPTPPVDAATRAVEKGRQVIFAHPKGVEVSKLEATAAITAVIGPEGGFTTAEVNAMTEAGAIPVGLGKNILRIESAAVSLVARLRLT